MTSFNYLPKDPIWKLGAGISTYKFGGTYNSVHNRYTSQGYQNSVPFNETLFKNCLGAKAAGLVVMPRYDQTSWVSVSSCVKGGSLCCWSSEGTSGSPREPLGWRNDTWVLSLSIPSLSQKPRLTVTGPEAPFSQGQVDCLLQGLQLYQGFKTSWREPEPGNQKYQEQWTWPHPGQLSDPSLRGHLIHRWRIQCQPGIRTFGRPLMGPLSMILCDIPAKEARAQETLAWQVLTVCSTKY